MSYQVQLTNGNVIAVVPDTQLVSTYGGLNLIGKFYPGFGTVFNDNLVHMTEHFADNTPPTNPFIGQIWYDTISSSINFWNGTQFKPISVITSSAFAPIDPQEGDEWYDSVNQQLNVWNGYAWVLIGPINQGGAKEGFVVQTLQTNTGNVYYLDLYANNALIGVVSSIALTNPAITGFENIRPGINFVTNPESAPSIIESGIYNITELTFGNVDQLSITVDSNENAIVEVGVGNVMIATNSSPAANLAAYTEFHNGNIGGTVYFDNIVANNYGNLPGTSFPGSASQIIYNNGTALAGSNALTILSSNVTARLDHLDVTDDANIGGLATVGTIFATTYENLPAPSPFVVPGSTGQFLYNSGGAVGATAQLTISGTTIIAPILSSTTFTVTGSSSLAAASASSLVISGNETINGTLGVAGITTLTTLIAQGTTVNGLTVLNNLIVGGSATVNNGSSGKFTLPTTAGSVAGAPLITNADGTTQWSTVAPSSGSNANGFWSIDESGCIRQWGTNLASGGGGGTNHTFPIPFTNLSSISIQSTLYYSSGPTIIPNVTSGSITLTGWNGGGSGASPCNINWFAIGF